MVSKCREAVPEQKTYFRRISILAAVRDKELLSEVIAHFTPFLPVLSLQKCINALILYRQIAAFPSSLLYGWSPFKYVNFGIHLSLHCSIIPEADWT
jgi:hypothetical protein